MMRLRPRIAWSGRVSSSRAFGNRARRTLCSTSSKAQRTERLRRAGDVHDTHAVAAVAKQTGCNAGLQKLELRESEPVLYKKLF